MVLSEFLERNLLIDSNGKVYDEDCNEYRDENGCHYLEVDNDILIDIIHCQLVEKRGEHLIELCRQ